MAWLIFFTVWYGLIFLPVMLIWLYHEQRWPRIADVTIGDRENPYLRRWWVIPRNRFFNIYLHQFLRSDTDEALHDHPWVNISILLKGEYVEVRPIRKDLRPINGNLKGILRRPFRPVFRLPSAAHRVLLFGEGSSIGPDPVWSLFITGPVMREWGFHCPQGWRHWKQFTVRDEAGNYVDGRGCE